MQVQKFIAENGWQALKDQLAIEVKEYDNGLRVLNYNQIESPRMHPVVDECRGLIMDQDANVVSRSFDRFYNFGEAGTDKSFDWDNTVAFEKCDGSLTKIYFCPQTNQWEISTRGTAFAEANHVFAQADGDSFRKWILKAIGVTEDEFQQQADQILDSNFTYIAEYVGPENRIVTRYAESMLVLLSVRHNQTGEENVSMPNNQYVVTMQSVGWNVRTPKVYDFSNKDDLVASLSDLPEMDEGYVVYNKVTGQRVKIKSPRYVAMHKLRGNGVPTWNNLAELVVTGETEEFETYFPEYTPLIEPIRNALNDMLHQASLKYDEVKHLESQKDFALAVKDFIFSGVLFTTRKLNCTVQHAFDQSSISNRIELVRKWQNQ